MEDKQVSAFQAGWAFNAMGCIFCDLGNWQISRLINGGLFDEFMAGYKARNEIVCGVNYD